MMQDEPTRPAAMRLTRRSTLAAALTAGLPGLARAQSGQVVVGTWGGDYAELLAGHIDRPLLRPQGVEVVQDVGPQDPRKAKLIAERQSRRGSMDVCCLSDIDMYTMAQQGVFEPATDAGVPNLARAIPTLKRDYSVPHIYSAKVILYNPAKVSAPPQGYADLWDPKYRGRVGLVDLLYLQNIESAALAGGGSQSDYEPGKRKLMELRSLDAKVYPSNEALAAGLKSEEVWLTIMWLARGFMWKKAGIPVEHAVPAEGATSICFEMSVPKNARNRDGAMAYLNAALDPRAQTAFADRMGYAPTVTDAVLPPDLARQISLTPEQQARLRAPDYDYIARNQAALVDFWNKEFKR
ncbi:ABC transporter substrate-binding protein [Siccirubricoccus phaeus]|uniref:ABC transporter substrate-binding protein n=1 Tax=Siccirubricoccus phaeus TaxID=2595053 RepID=UPI001F3A0E5D|nr:ABC transporter substrate-binding protein [Siccirubricoccus phaeus]